MSLKNDKRIVLTLDAGGTNFVFAAIQGNEFITDELRMDSNGDDLSLCLNTIVTGFRETIAKLGVKPDAISFAFPGPADYDNGIIGDLANLPGFNTGGFPLADYLENIFGIPVFINNDGDLYAYGEAISGFLPYVNRLLEEAGSPKRYKNLLGLTLGTGFGGGIVSDGILFRGDNSMAGEIWLVRNKLYPQLNIEESASIRGVKRVYSRLAGINFESAPSPKEIFEIAEGMTEGNKEAALGAFKEMGEAVGNAISDVVTMLDCLVVIGGGLSGASPVFMPFILNEMNSGFTSFSGRQFPRLGMKVYNLEDKNGMEEFLKSSKKEILVPGTNKKVIYDPIPRTGIGISRIGTSKAIASGAYAFALSRL